MKPGEVWSCGPLGDPSPWYYLVLESDDDGVDMVLLDADGKPDCEPGDRIELLWDDIQPDSVGLDRLVWDRWLVWELVG